MAPSSRSTTFTFDLPMTVALLPRSARLAKVNAMFPQMLLLGWVSSPASRVHSGRTRAHTSSAWGCPAFVHMPMRIELYSTMPSRYVSFSGSAASGSPPTTRPNALASTGSCSISAWDATICRAQSSRTTHLARQLRARHTTGRSGVATAVALCDVTRWMQSATTSFDNSRRHSSSRTLGSRVMQFTRELRIPSTTTASVYSTFADPRY
mmetsp:Transcript_108540/g.187624  ORF Transcript_108540/g.187624 Transcript_108540/m.187624 type:complete len:209 (-) Transcript_108540:1663-2289(-)